MSIQTKIRFKNFGKIVGGILFALILFTNIKVALLDDAEMVSGDVSILGLNLSIFDATYGESSGTYNWVIYTSTCVNTNMGLFCQYACILPYTPHCSQGDSGYGYP